MPDRWPAAMKLSTLAEYLDVSETTARAIVKEEEFSAVQFTERGDRYYLREDADAYLRRLSTKPVKGAKAS